MTAHFPRLQERLRECRRAAGLRQRELAAKSGVATGYIGELETSGDTNPTLETIGELAEALGVSPAYLLGVDALTLMPRAAGLGRGESFSGDDHR